jgi:8-oxo-dGTP pyrophosphatase MutT (NUDIX family)
MIHYRTAARAILLTPDREILLLRIQPPGGGDLFWITPGGGLELGESAEQGLRRELKEELGIEDFAFGPRVWRRQHTYTWAEQRICQLEEYFIVTSPRFDLQMCDPIEMAVVERMRWWPVTELAQAHERLTPLSLAGIVASYLAEGPPRQVPDVEVLVD